MSTQFQPGKTPRVIEPNESSVQRTLEVQDNSALNRWGWMAGFDIDLSQLSGSNFLGDFPGEKIPRRTLFKIREAMALGPNELPAITSRSEVEITREHLGVLEEEWASDAGRQSSKTFVNSPGFIAKRLDERFGVEGLAIFEADGLLDLDREKALFLCDSILPPPTEWSDFGMHFIAEREVLSVPYVGPFLDQVREFLRRHSGAYMRNVAHLRGSDLQKANAMRSIMITATERAWRFENRILNTSEEQIIRFQNGKRGKEWYDRPDERFENARARDLEFLADLGRAPLNEKQIEIAKRLAEGSNSAIVSGMGAIANQFSAAADKMVNASKGAGAPAEDDSDLARKNARLTRLLAMVPDEVLETIESQIQAGEGELDEVIEPVTTAEGDAEGDETLTIEV